MSTGGEQRKIGLIGLGLMGRPMGMNLLKAGYSVTVWNRTPSRADELVAAGATLAKTPREVGAASDVLITMVSDPPALEYVLWGQEEKDGALDGLKAGALTLTRAQYRRAGEEDCHGLSGKGHTISGRAGDGRRLGSA